MSFKLESYVNSPFDGNLLKGLFQNQQDLKLANPKASFPFDIAEWEQLINDSAENCSLIFKIDSDIVGHTALIPHEEVLYLCFVILHPNFRGNGLGKRMIELSEEFVRLNYPHKELHLHVNKANDKAKGLYLKLSYEVYKEEKDRFKMKKSLR